MQKQILFKVKGMHKDLSASAFNPEYAYENKNIRIMPTNESTLLSIINEKGNRSNSIVFKRLRYMVCIFFNLCLDSIDFI